MKNITVADLKRIEVGTCLTLVHSLLGPCRKLRRLKKVQSNALVLETETGEESYLTLPKAKQLSATPDGFQITEEDTGEVSMRYVWGHLDASGFVHLSNIMKKKNKYDVIFMVRERGAIGIFQKMRLIVEAETPQEAHDLGWETIQKNERIEPSGEYYVTQGRVTVWPEHAKGKIV